MTREMGKSHHPRNGRDLWRDLQPTREPWGWKVFLSDTEKSQAAGEPS